MKQLFFSGIYNRIGSYFKNTNYTARELCAGVRRICNLKEWLRRKNISSISYIGGTHRIDQDIGALVLGNGGNLNYIDAIIKDADKRLEKFDPESVDWRDKPHLYSGLLDQNQLELGSPYLQFALQPEVISIVSDYMNMVPVLSYAGLWYSPPSTQSYINSQLFHCDQADTRQMKIFIFCSDVTEKEGPLTFINSKKSRGIQKKIGYSWSNESQMVNDETIGSIVKSEEIVSATGSRGTVAFVDTSRCFHYGSRISEGSKFRLVAVFQFLSPFAFLYPWDYKKKLPFGGKFIGSSEINAIQRQVIGAID